MKKNFFIGVFVSFLSILNSNAQNKGDFELGAGFGRQISLDYDENYESRYQILTSLNTSVSGEYYFSDRWGLKMKLIHDTKGWSNTKSPDPLSFNQEIGGFERYVDASHKLNYVTIPIMANWHFGKNKNWYLNFGPYFGFLLDTEDTAFGWDLKKTLYKDSDFGLSYGIGYKFTVGDHISLFVEYERQLGFTNIYKYGSETIKNSRVGLNLGALFCF